MAAVAVFRISTIKLAGAEGEERTLRQLKTLPSAYTLFNQLDIPSAPSRTGAMEADLVVVGPNGVFVIEVKHNNGTIFGDNASPQWPVAKVGPRGGAYQSAMRNPIRQLGGQIAALKGYLKSQSIEGVWIEGIVYFSNPAAGGTVQRYAATDAAGHPRRSGTLAAGRSTATGVSRDGANRGGAGGVAPGNGEPDAACTAQGIGFMLSGAHC